MVPCYLSSKTCLSVMIVVQMESVLAGVVVMLAAMTQGLTGFGFALVSVPVLMLFEDAHLVIVTTLILGLVLNGFILLQVRGRVSWRKAGLITAGSLLGVPFGSYMLTVLDSGALKTVVAALVVLFSVPLLLGYSARFRHGRLASLLAGTVSGALQGSTGMGAPPVVLFMANQGLPKEVFRGMMVVRSTAASALSVMVLAPTGMIDSTVALHSLLLVPALAIGMAAGTRLLRHVPQRFFKTLTVLVVATSSMVSVAAALL